MTKEEIMDLYNSQTLTIVNHCPLVAISCATWDDEEANDDYWLDEFVFTVPIEWLVDYMNKQPNGWDTDKWDWSKVQNWLQNEYTYEDSKPIFDQAIQENVCVTLNF